MLLAIITVLNIAQAHPAHRPPPPVVHVETQVHPVHRWINAHYDRWGRWVPGHWVVVPRTEVEVCSTDRRGITWCGTI